MQSRSRSPSRRLSKSPDRSYNKGSPSRSRYVKSTKNKSSQEEYTFPIGLHADIDQSIIQKMDFDGLIHLLTIDRSPKLRKVVYDHLSIIINNTPNFRTKLQDYGYQLLLLRELSLLKKLLIDHPKLLPALSTKIDFTDTIQLEDFLSLLNKKEVKSFLNRYTQSIEIEYAADNIKDINDILKAAIETNNTDMIEQIKKWYKYIENTYHELNILTNQLNSL